MQDVSVVYPLHSFQSQLEPSTRALKVWKIQWWMAHYGSRTPKRHVGYSNCACIGSLGRGRLPKRVKKKLKKKHLLHECTSTDGVKCAIVETRT